jgi:hypothetical protein
MRREYKSGQRWAFWRWTDIKLDDKLYLRRLHIVQVPKLGAIMVHWIMLPDSQPDMHDHPVSFFSILLRGRYMEETPDGMRLVFRYNFKRATDMHRIVAVPTTGVTTLVFAAPKSREWGFHTAHGFVPWRNYKE